MIRLLTVVTCATAIALGVMACQDYRTPAEKQRDAQTAQAAGDVGSLFGIPRALVEAVTGVVLLGVGHLHGNRRGRRKAAAAAPAAPSAQV